MITQSPTRPLPCLLLAAHSAQADAQSWLEVHGDWGTATRLYGARLRTILSPAADAGSRYAVRHDDAVAHGLAVRRRDRKRAGVDAGRLVSGVHGSLPVPRAPPAPLPEQPVALFVAYSRPTEHRGPRRCLAARRAQLPEAKLVLVGSGSRADVVEKAETTRADGVASPARDARGSPRGLDEATVLLLPSHSEGLGSVIIEALCRGQPVIGSRVAGIADLLEDGVNGVLVEPETPRRSPRDSCASSRTDRWSSACARGARECRPWLLTHNDYAERTRELVDHIAYATEP